MIELTDRPVPLAGRTADAYTTSIGRSRNMAAIRRRDTNPEMALRRALHARGRRYRVDYAVRVDGHIIRPDIAFTRHKIAVFIDGCFWHSCPVHGRRPKKNTRYWSPKLQRNAERDARQTTSLESAGWKVLRIWAHVPLSEMVDLVDGAME